MSKLDHSQDKTMFSLSFHNQVDSLSGKKDHLIDSITQKIYEKHKSVISYKKVHQFTQNQLRGKHNIESSDLTKIENKIKSAL